MDTSYSRYEQWVSEGNTGSYEDFTQSLREPMVIQGPAGPAGRDGIDANLDPVLIGQEIQSGIATVIGHVITSPVAAVVSKTIEGTFKRLKDSGELTGPNGKDGTNGKDGIDGQDGKDGRDGKDGLPGIMGPKGHDGKQGAKGDPGRNGKDGSDGKSAYDLWLDSGNKGTEEDYHQSIAKNAAYWGGVIIGGRGGSSSASNITGLIQAGTGISFTGAGTLVSPYIVNSSATGNVSGPASSTDNAITRFDGITGKIIQDSLVTINDLGAVSVPNGAVAATSINFGTAGTGFYSTSNLNTIFSSSGTARFIFSNNGIHNITNSNNGRIQFPSTGITITRDVADVNSAFIVTQSNVGSTGDIQEWANNTGVVAMFKQDGNLQIIPLSGTGSRPLYADATGNVTTSPGAYLTNGSVLFSNGTAIAEDNANFFWDDINNYHGIGTNTPSARVHAVTNALGTTQSDTSGLKMENTTAAAAGAQQISPALVLQGNGWKTSATAASQPVAFRVYNTPVQGTTAPTGQLSFEASVNGGAYSNVASLDSAGLLTLQNGVNTNGGISTNTTTSSNLYIPVGSNASTTTTASYLFAGATTVSFRVGYRGSVTVSVAANNSYASQVMGNMTVSEAATGTHALMAGYVMKPLTITDGAGATTNTATLYLEGQATGITPTGDNYTLWSAGGPNRFDGDMRLSKTITPAGTTGARTINNNTGSVNFAAGAASLVVTNNLVTVNSIIQATVATNDANMFSVQIIAAAGSFTLMAQPSSPGAETRVNFTVTN